MNAVVLSGKELAAQIRARVTETIAAGAVHGAPPPRLAVVSATADAASAWYVRSIANAAGKVGIECEVVALGQDASVEQLVDALGAAGANESVHGIILQTPLPDGASLAHFAHLIPAAKDVDGANPLSLGRLATGLPAFAPATAEAVLRLLDHHGYDLSGRHAVVVGRSAVVGKPLAHLLLDRHATVTIAHSRTRKLAETTRSAEILIAAAGRAGLITPQHVRPGAVVIDVGTNPGPDGGLVGDVDAKVAEVASALSPVPGGVGPVTTALLLEHTLKTVESLYEVFPKR